MHVLFNLYWIALFQLISNDNSIIINSFNNINTEIISLIGNVFNIAAGNYYEISSF
jgi:hypothetical protein